MTDSRRLAFVGLGVMGYPMAGHLAAAGHQLAVYNRTQAKAEQWCEEHGGSVANCLLNTSPSPPG